MRELVVNLWETPADLRAVTTNGHVAKDGRAAMGRGCALEAKEMIPGIEYRIGELLREHGNRPMRLCRFRGAELASFPAKHHWREAADPDLIRRSAYQLVALVERFSYSSVVIPRPGCGNGSLSWSDVRPLLAEVLDDRFTVVSFRQRSQPTLRRVLRAPDRAAAFPSGADQL